MMKSDQATMLSATTARFLDTIPLPMLVYQVNGVGVLMNTAAEDYFHMSRQDFNGVYNVLKGEPEMAERFQSMLERALREGAFERSNPTPDVRAANTDKAEELWYRASIYPIRDGSADVTHLGYVFHDATEHMRQEQYLRQAQSEIEAHQRLILELSTPIVEVWDEIILLPVVGTLNDARVSAIMEDLLIAIGHYSASVVILDITGVPMVDTQVANYLIMAARAVRLLGAAIVLVGIRSEIAQTLVSLGIDLSTLHCQANLKAGIAWALAQQRLRVSQIA